jgi:hypothetical protein
MKTREARKQDLLLIQANARELRMADADLLQLCVGLPVLPNGLPCFACFTNEQIASLLVTLKRWVRKERRTSAAVNSPWEGHERRGASL